MVHRDLVGYGKRPPDITWPGGKRIAISVVVNVEEGAELSYLAGDERQESYGETSKVMPEGVQDLTNLSVYDYGLRVGLWRFLGLLKRLEIPATFFMCGRSVESYLEAAAAIVQDGHEICGHGYTWVEPYLLSAEEELRSIRMTVQAITRATGKQPVGWYSRYAPSKNTRRILMREGNFIYDSDSVSDEVPFYVWLEESEPFLVVPYTLDANDMRFWAYGGFGTGSDFYEYLRDSFDVLYEESRTRTKIMSIGLHLRISGRPGRHMGIVKFLEYASQKSGTWFARREDIARWWWEKYPPERLS